MTNNLSEPNRLSLGTLKWVSWELNYIKGSPGKALVWGPIQSGGECIPEMGVQVGFFPKQKELEKQIQKSLEISWRIKISKELEGENF